MPTNNFKLFDQNKANLLSDTEYANATQRLNGVQTGVASSQLQNKFAYQVSLVAYAIAQIMNQNGLDATDTLAVSAFVGNLGGSLLQKVADKASTAEAAAGVLTNKYISPATMKAAALLLSGGVMTGTLDMNNNKITNLPTPTSSSEPATKEYVDGNSGLAAFKKKLLFSGNVTKSNPNFTKTLDDGLQEFLNFSGILVELKIKNIKENGDYDTGVCISNSAINRDNNGIVLLPFRFSYRDKTTDVNLSRVIFAGETITCLFGGIVNTVFSPYMNPQNPGAIMVFSTNSSYGTSWNPAVLTYVGLLNANNFTSFDSCTINIWKF